jgi:ATP-dependent Clp protease ATP-binding subunit ClpA
MSAQNLPVGKPPEGYLPAVLYFAVFAEHLMSKKMASARIFEQWTERDLTAAALKGDLSPAFEIEDQLNLASEVLFSGRNLLITGESGVGKTALVCELVRRAGRTDDSALSGKQVLQFSFRHRVATLKTPNMLLPEMQRLVEALCEAGDRIVPFFRDFHLAEAFNLEAQIQALAYRFDGLVLGEAEPGALSALFESMPELDQQYVTLAIQEPDLETAAKILRAWAVHYQEQNGVRFPAEALDEALHLSHRFLARTRLPRKALDLLVQVAGLRGERDNIERSHVIERFSNVHHVPRELVDPLQPLDLSALTRDLGQQLLGQPEAVEIITRTISLIKSGLADMRRPFGVFLFAGPTGVGKTHTAQLLAQHLFGSRERMIRLNMADYQSEHAPQILFGDPTDYRLPLRRGLVTQRISGQPFAVLLLDEFEKAHEKVADRFLQLFDEGSFINGHGETIACRSMILIATSNIGAELYRERPAGFFSTPDLDRLSHEMDRRLAQRFRLELLNRFDQIVQFRPLSRMDVRRIAARELESLKERIGFKRSGMDLEIDDTVLDWLAVQGYDPRFGARFLRRTLERDVTSALAGLLVRGKIAAGAHAVLTVRRNNIEARIIAPEPAVKRRVRVTPERLGTAGASSVTPEILRRRAAELVAAAGRLFASLQTKHEEARRLLDTMNEPGFWDRGIDCRDTLERYRTIDVTLQVEERYAAALRELDSAREGDRSNDLNDLARSVMTAEQAFSDWNNRLAEEGARELWLSIEGADVLQGAGPWLLELARMELEWCRRVYLEAKVAACEIVDGALSRVLLQVEGPGAGAYLAAEEGIHRRTRNAFPDLKARILIIPRGAQKPQAPPRIVKVKQREGPLGLSISYSGHVEIPSSGTVVDLFGSDSALLTDVLSDFATHRHNASVDRTSIARTYGKDGVGARDPRTGATALRMKDVLRGNLDTFLQAWRAQAPNIVDAK